MKRVNVSENQMALPFRDLPAGRHGGQSRTVTLEDRARFFWFITSISLISLLFYIYAVNATAHHIAVRQNLEREVSQVAVRLSTLEFASIALTNDITLEVAHQYGFQEVRKPLYVSRGPEQSLTLNTVTR